MHNSEFNFDQYIAIKSTLSSLISPRSQNDGDGLDLLLFSLFRHLVLRTLLNAIFNVGRVQGTSPSVAVLDQDIFLEVVDVGLKNFALLRLFPDSAIFQLEVEAGLVVNNLDGVPGDILDQGIIHRSLASSTLVTLRDIHAIVSLLSSLLIWAMLSDAESDTFSVLTSDAIGQMDGFSLRMRTLWKFSYLTILST